MTGSDKVSAEKPALPLVEHRNVALTSVQGVSIGVAHIRAAISSRIASGHVYSEAGPKCIVVEQTATRSGSLTRSSQCLSRGARLARSKAVTS